jgi:hypothetical protein
LCPSAAERRGLLHQQIAATANLLSNTIDEGFKRLTRLNTQPETRAELLEDSDGHLIPFSRGFEDLPSINLFPTTPPASRRQLENTPWRTARIMLNSSAPMPATTSRHPKLPQLHGGPSSLTCVCPNSPLADREPSSGCPPEITPAQIPLPYSMKRNRGLAISLVGLEMIERAGSPSWTQSELGWQEEDGVQG